MTSERFLAWFERPGAYFFAVLAGVLVALPAVGAGLFVDDYLHILTLEGRADIATKGEVFQFAPGNRDTLKEFMNSGPYPWWAFQDLSIKFMRPLSSALMEFDVRVFGRNVAGYHLHAVAWYLVCLLIVAWMYRRSLPLGLGALALLLYALDVGHLVPVGWWSNRNALIAAVPAMAGLLCHLEWRERDWLPGLPLSVFFLALGLAGGETALGIFGYLFAYEAVSARGSLARRFFMLVPAGLLGLIYLVLYKGLGYGSYGSGIYIDPMRDTGEFLTHAVPRLLLVVAGHFALLPSEMPVVANWTYWPLVALSLLVVLVMVKLLRHALVDLEAEHRRHVRWYILGALISCVPILATFPSIRLMMLPSLGLVVLLAVILQYLLARGRAALPWWQWRAAGALVALHLVLPPLIWLAVPMALRKVDNRIQEVFLTAPFDHEAVTGQHVIILHSENPMFSFYPMIMYRYHGYPDARSWWPLSMAPHAHVVRRTGEKVFEVEVVDGELLRTDPERLLRAPEPKFVVGEEVALEGMTVRVLEVGEVGPRKFRVTLADSADDPKYLYLAWQDRQLRPVEMPEVGGELVLGRQGWF